MANDITTLAIEIQSQEAERNLRTFNELLSLSSQTAKKMEKVSIEIDVQGALAQLQALKTGYDDLASSAQNVHIDMGGGEAPTVDTSALEALKDFFTTSAEMSKAMREEMTQFNEALLQLEANSVKAATAGGSHTESMSGGVSMSREYAAALKEVAAAQKEMEKAAAKADEAMKATVAADEDAEAVKRRLMKAQRELANVSKQVNEFYHTQQGNIIELSEKEEYLKNKVAELKGVYAEAKAAAEKFNQKLEESGEKADAARQHYQELKAQLDAMPQPMGQVTGSMGNFSHSARGAATQVTKIARGFNAVAYSAGAAIPALTKVGQVVGTFAYAGPIVGSIVVGVGALAAAIKHMYDEYQKGFKLAHEHAVQAQKDFQDTKSSIADLTKEWDRLGELTSAGALTNEQNLEATRIIGHLTDVYGDLGLGIDAATRKLKGYSQARAEANEREREHEIYMARQALKKARRDAAKQRERYEGVDAARDFLATLKGKSDEEIWRALQKRKSELEDIQANEKRYTHSIGKSRTSSAYRSGGIFNAAMMSAASPTGQLPPQVVELQLKEMEGGIAAAKVDKELELLKGDGKDNKGLIDAYKRAAEAKRTLAEIEIAPQSRFNRQREALAKQGLQIDESGNARLLTAAEQYVKQKAEISSLERDIATEVQRHGKTSEEYLRLEAQREKLLLSTLQYEKKITAEQERRRKGISAKYKQDPTTEIWRRKDSAEIDLFRAAEQIKLLKEMQEMRRNYAEETGGDIDKDFAKGKLPEDIREKFAKKQREYDELSIQRLTAREARQAAIKQREAGRKNFVYGRNGQIIREKTDKEKDRDLAAELAEAKKRAKRYTEGSEEWHRAMMEVDRLQQEQFRRKQETSYSNLGFSEKQAHNNMVQGIRAQSSQALQLETRNFNKPDNAWKTLEKTQTRIYDTVSGYGTHIESMSSNMQNIAGQVAPV